MNLYQQPVGDDKKYNGYETQFLVDTGATCSLLNYYSYENLCNVQKLKITPTKSSTIAVNGERLKILGSIVLKSSFDIEGQYEVEQRILVSEKNGAKHNILGMDFLQSCSNNIDLTTPKMDLKVHPGVSAKLFTFQSKSFPYIGIFNQVCLDNVIEIAPLTTRIITVHPPNYKIPKGTSFVLSEKITAKGVHSYNVFCSQDEKELPVMLNNPGHRKVVLGKGYIGHTILDIDYEQFVQFSVFDNIAFIDLILKNDADINHLFHVTDCVLPSIINELDKKEDDKINPAIGKRIKQKQQNFSENYELPTDFSDELKNLKPKAEQSFITIRDEKLDKKLLSKFQKSDREFLQKFDFSQSDIDEKQLAELLEILVLNKDVYSLHKYEVGVIKQRIHVKLLPNDLFRKQRPSRVPLHYEEKLKSLLEQLIQSGIIREMGDDNEMGSMFINPIIILPKGNIVKLVIGVRYLNSITDLTSYSWPLEPVGALINRLNGKYFTTSDLCSAYNQVPLTEETQKLTSCVIGSKQYTFQRGFYGLYGLPNFFSRIMTIHFTPLIRNNQAITYIDDTIMQAQTQNEMFRIIVHYHHLLRKSALKAQPEKTKFFLRKVQFLGHVVGKDGIQPVKKRVADLHALKSPEKKRDVMRVLGCLGFYSMYIKNLHVDCKPFYDLIRDDTVFEWKPEHEKLFCEIKK